MSDPRAWDEALGYVRYEMAAGHKLVMDAMGVLGESLRQLDARRIGIERTLAELDALLMRLRDTECEDYGEHVRAVLAGRYLQATTAGDMTTEPTPTGSKSCRGVSRAGRLGE